MVFTKLSAQEKAAFFSLLDEYFQSRPELLGQRDGQGRGGLAGTGISTTAATSAVQRVLAANTTGSSGGDAGASTAGGFKSANPFGTAIATPSSADVARAVSVGRVAAASLAISQGGMGTGTGSHVPSTSTSTASWRSVMPAGGGDGSGGPPTLPRRAAPGVEVDKLVTRKASVLNAFKKTPAVGVSVPPAFAPPQNTYGPPPVRRATSAPPEEVAEGEWAEVLYDYSSEDPGDLAVEAGTRVFVTAKSSEDWWTGQVEGRGREGLFPASYVKLL